MTDEPADPADPAADAADDELEHLEIVVETEGRLDVVIAAQVATLSRVAAQRLIAEEHVRLGTVVITKAGAKMRRGEVISIDVPAPTVLEVTPENIPLSVLFEDADLIVIDKPAGLVVHPAVGHPNGTLVNALLYHCTDLSGIGGVLRPGIVHRLDKNTSGVMVATKSDRAHEGLAAAFADKVKNAVERSYLAIASPAPVGGKGTIRTFHGRHPTDRKRFSSKVPAGKVAVTQWELVERLHLSALIKVTLETGRTHQIRVHAADHGWPLIGDGLYGWRPRDPRVAEVATTLARQALHAQILGFVHPITGERMRFEAPIPADFAAALAALRD